MPFYMTDCQLSLDYFNMTDKIKACIQIKGLYAVLIRTCTSMCFNG